MRADLASKNTEHLKQAKYPKEAKHAVSKQRKQSAGYIICVHTRHNKLSMLLMLLIYMAHSLMGRTAAKMAGLQEGVEHLLAIISSFSKTHIPSLCSAIIKG